MFYCLINKELNNQSAKVRISGPDAYTYLQGQFSQDLNAPIGGSAYGLWLNQKGKALADSTVLRCAEKEFLILSTGVAPAELRARLEAYLIADEVELADESATAVPLVLIGDGCGALLAGLLAVSPGPGRYVEAAGAVVHPGRYSTQENYVAWLRPESVAQWRDWLARAGVSEAGVATVERERILAGIPAVPRDIGPNDLPNEGGLDAVAISYTKGCFLGQEVMARLKNLGQVRRRLHQVRGTGVAPASGTPFFQGERRIGELRSTVRDGDGWIGLAMLGLVGLDAAAPLAVGAPDGTRAEILPHG